MTNPLQLRNPITVFAAALAGYALLGSFLSFLGWSLNIPRLTDWFDQGISIQPNACVLIMFSGAAVILVQLGKWRAVVAIGALVGLGGALILLQHLTGVDFGFNHQLQFGRTWGQNATLTPGRVGPPASSTFVLIGAALVLLGRANLQSGRPRPGRRLVPAIGVATCAVMAFSILSYLFEARQFYATPSLTAIAFQTATMLLAIGMALIASVPEHDPMRLLRERSGAGALGRITIPAFVAMIPLLIWLRIEGYEEGFYDLGMSRALGALTMMTGAIAILWVALTALRRREHALREADRRKDEFLATLAHELRNPLAPLTNALTILEKIQGGNTIEIELRAMMSRQLKQLVRLIDDLFDVSRISRGRVDIRKERVEFPSVLEEAIEGIRPICAAAQQELTVEMPSQRPWIEADRVRIVQMITNLLSNASRYSASGTLIEVRASCEGRDIVLSVRDQGTGIPPEKLEAIFAMFYQADSPLERASGGLGIGLYLVKRLAEMHGGTVTARSEGLGRGSEFVLRLPIVTDGPGTVESVEAAEQQRSIPQAQSIRVLVVDDNADTAITMATLLNTHGYVTQMAQDGLEAIEAAERFRPNVVLLDIGLPKLNGYEVCRRLRKQLWGRNIVIIALTGWGQRHDQIRAAESGFTSHLVKPVEWATLLQLLESHINPQNKSARSIGQKLTAGARRP